MATGDEIMQSYHPLPKLGKGKVKTLNKGGVMKSFCVCSRNAEHTEKEIEENECSNCKRKVKQTVL